MKKLLLLYIISLFLCQCNIKKEEKLSEYEIDLTVSFNDDMNSYKMDENGDVIFLSNKLNKPGKLYKFKLTDREKDSIQNEIEKLVLFKCDTVEENYVDGTRYMLVFKKKKKKIILFDSGCRNKEIVNNFVFNFVKKFNNTKNKAVFETLDKYIPIELPDSLNIH